MISIPPHNTAGHPAWHVTFRKSTKARTKISWIIYAKDRDDAVEYVTRKLAEDDGAPHRLHIEKV